MSRRTKKMTKVLAGAALTGTLALGITTTSYATGMYWNLDQPTGAAGGLQNGQGMTSSNVTLSDSPSEIVTGNTSNSAQYLTADESNSTIYVMSDSDNEIKIDTAGTYIITGSCSDGNITVKKNTTGVVLILRDLNLTSTTGATLSCNKYSEIKIIVEGTVILTDAENPADENSTDADTADAFDGAALKIKDGAQVYLTGTGTLNIDASSCKNGIKVGNEDAPSLIIDGTLSINITAANDAVNSGYDLAILGGNMTISAGDDALHADRILTIGEGGYGPSISITSSYEGLEGTIVNLFGGTVSLNSSDDGVNAANSDGTYSELTYSINITGGTYTIKTSGDGLDSNGNINITGGYTTISSASFGGEAGIDYDGTCYIADGTMNNNSGISGPDQMPGQTGMNGMGMQNNLQYGQMPNNGTQNNLQNAQIPNNGTQNNTQNNMQNGMQYNMQNGGMNTPQSPIQPNSMNQQNRMQNNMGMQKNRMFGR